MRRRSELDITHDDLKKSDPGASGNEAEKYKGVVFPDFSISLSVIICAVAGAVLGLILAMWGTSEIPIIISVTIVFGSCRAFLACSSPVQASMTLTRKVGLSTIGPEHARFASEPGHGR